LETIYNILEATDMEILVVNARHIKAVPGRKTDVKDAEWIADLLRHGLLQGSFIPDREQREFRELVRYRTKLTQERSREVNRIQKVLEGANIKLGDVASDIMGKSGQDMLRAIIAGEQNPQAIAQLARGKLKSKTDLLEKALTGLIGSHQKMLLKTQLRHINFLDEQIQTLSQEIENRMLNRLKDLSGRLEFSVQHIRFYHRRLLANLPLIAGFFSANEILFTPSDPVVLIRQIIH
jgi:transposase